MHPRARKAGWLCVNMRFCALMTRGALLGNTLLITTSPSVFASKFPKNLSLTYLIFSLMFATICYLYYYSNNLSSKFDENLPVRSQFDSDHRINLSTPTSCQSATFVRQLFAFVLCFLRQKSSKNHKCDESVSIGVIDQVRSTNDDPSALLQINR